MQLVRQHFTQRRAVSISACVVSITSSLYEPVALNSATPDFYNRTLAQMDFIPGPNQPGNGVSGRFYDRTCFERPRSCSFRLQCEGACTGLYLAAGANAGGPCYPTALVPNPAEGPRKRTNFTVQTGMRWSIVQGGKRYFASIPSKDADAASSIISFRPQAAVDSGAARALSCMADLMYRFRCSAGAAGSNKNQFFSCPSTSSARRHLEISRVDGAGKGGCAGGQRIDLRYADYQP